MCIKYIKNNTVYILAVVLNIILSYSMLLYREPFNVDGIIYLHAAQAYLSHGWQGALQIYPWPFYSVLIAKISQFTHLALLSSAFFLNVILTCILVYFFLLLIKACGGTRVHQYWGLLIILLYPFLNHDRYNVLRDFGYYAFFLVSLWCFIKFLQQPKVSYGFFWQITVLIASAFRIEGIILLAMVPVFIVLYSQKIMDGLKFSWFTLLLLGIMVTVSSSFIHFGRIPEMIADLQIHNLITLFHQKLEIIRSQVLGVLAQDGVLLFFIGGMITVFLGTIINTFGVFSTVLLGYSVKQKLMLMNTPAQKAIFIYGMIVSLTLLGFLAHQLFLSERYVMPLVLLLMLALPFALKALYEKPQVLFKIIIIMFLLLNTVSSFGHFGPSKTYLIDAGEWIAKHIPVTAKVYLNDAQLAYYAHRSGTQQPLDSHQLRNYVYIAVVIKHNEENSVVSQIMHEIGHPPLKIFQNNRNDRVLIFKFQDNA